MEELEPRHVLSTFGAPGGEVGPVIGWEDPGLGEPGQDMGQIVWEVGPGNEQSTDAAGGGRPGQFSIVEGDGSQEDGGDGVPEKFLSDKPAPAPGSYLATEVTSVVVEADPDPSPDGVTGLPLSPWGPGAPSSFGHRDQASRPGR